MHMHRDGFFALTPPACRRVWLRLRGCACVVWLFGCVIVSVPRSWWAQDKLNSLPDDSPSARGVLDQLRDAERRYEAALSASINLPKSGAGVAPPHTPGSASGRNLHRGQSSASMLLPPEAPPVPETLQEVRWAACCKHWRSA